MQKDNKREINSPKDMEDFERQVQEVALRKFSSTPHGFFNHVEPRRETTDARKILKFISCGLF